MANKTTKKTEKVIEDPTVFAVEHIETEVQKPTVKKANRKFAPDDAIECRSVTGGELVLIGPKTKLQYNWSNYGDTSYVEYQDLLALQSRKSGFLTKPRFIIEDEELVEQWAPLLKPIYEKIVTKTVDDLFELDLVRFRTALTQLPSGVKDAVKTRAVQMIKSNELYDIRIIKIMDEILGTDFVGMYLK